MAQLVITLCDLCAAEPEDGDAPPRPHLSAADRRGDPVVVAIGEGAAPVVLDLCPDHAARLVGPLQSALAEHGRRLPPPDVVAKAKAKGPRGPYKPRAVDGPGFTCLVCGHRTASPAGTSQHLRAAHDLDATGAYGDGPAVCPLCDATSDHVHGIATHAVAAHDLPGDGATHRVWSAAIDQGDPTGAVAKRRAELGVTYGEPSPAFASLLP